MHFSPSIVVALAVGAAALAPAPVRPQQASRRSFGASVGGFVGGVAARGR